MSSGPQPNRWDWLTPGRFALLLGLMTFAAHADVLLGWRTFVARDFGVLSYPMAMHQRESFWQGEWPLWDPYTRCGTPFLAVWNTLALYPPSLLYLLLPMPWSLNLVCVLHQFLAGLGMYFLAYRWTGHRFAAAVAGVGLAFGGITESFLVYAGNGMAWMPWILWLGERAWRLGGRAVLWAALVGAVQMLSGLPEPILFSWLLLGLLLAVQTARDPAAWKLRFLRAGLLVLVIAALTAVQLIPFLDLLRHSQRSLGAAAKDTWWMAPSGLANLLLPMFRVERLSCGLVYPAHQSVLPSYYPGIGVLALALWAACVSRTWLTRCLVVVAALGVWLALGNSAGLLKIARAVFPVLNLIRFPVKYVMLAGVVLPLLAALALRDWLQGPVQARPALRRWGLGVAAGLGLSLAGLVAFTAYRPAEQGEATRVLLSGLSRGAFLAGCACVVGLLPRFISPRAQRGLALALLGLLWLDAQTSCPPPNPATNPSVFALPGPAALSMHPVPVLGQSRGMLSARATDALDQKTVPDVGTTYLFSRMGLYPNCHLPEHIPMVDGFFPMLPATAREVAQCYLDANGNPKDRWADFLGVNQVMLADKLEWRFRPSARPLITSGQQPLCLDRTNTLAYLAADAFAPDQVVVLPPEARPSVTAIGSQPAQVSGLQFTAQRISFTAKAEQPAMVVIAQTYYHWWQADVDGQATPLWRANHGFQALQVPAGRHRVQLTYRDRGFQLGGAISLAAAAGWLVAWFRLRERTA